MVALQFFSFPKLLFILYCKHHTEEYVLLERVKVVHVAVVILSPDDKRMHHYALSGTLMHG